MNGIIVMITAKRNFKNCVLVFSHISDKLTLTEAFIMRCLWFTLELWNGLKLDLTQHLSSYIELSYLLIMDRGPFT